MSVRVSIPPPASRPFMHWGPPQLDLAMESGSKANSHHIRGFLSEEIGTIRKPWGGRIPVALVYPNTYAVGMANLGFQLIYHLLNLEEDVVCERSFGDLSPPTSLESAVPLHRFEVVAFSISFENDYPTVVKILLESGIPALSHQRRPPHPMVWVGGIAPTMNPEPLAPFVDIAIIGDGEAVLPRVLEVYRKSRKKRFTKEEALESVAQISGVYVPSLHDVEYDPNGGIKGIRHRVERISKVEKAVQWDLSQVIPCSRVLSPHTQFPSMFLVEISRGCPRRCRFCAATHVLKPVRHRPWESMAPLVAEGLKWSKRIGLISSCVGDHPQIDSICKDIIAMGGRISPASLRMDALGEGLLEAIRKSGIKTVSLAPEAGSWRLRRAIGKPIKDEQIFDCVERLVRASVSSMRLYFMVGLPTETLEDIEAIVELVKRVNHVVRKTTRGGSLERLTLSVNPFVPKPATPFQFHPMEDVQELKGRIRHLIRSLRRDPKVRVIFEPPKWARIQGLLSLGDRRLAPVILLVSQGRHWDQALREFNINVDYYVHRGRGPEERLPWDIIDHGLIKEELWDAYKRATAC